MHVLQGWAGTADVIDADALLRDAVIYVRNGCFEEAIRLLDHALVFAPTSATRALVLRHRSDANRGLCRWDAALEDAEASFREASLADDDDLLAEALNAQGAIHHTRGELDAAKALYERVERHASSSRLRGIAFQNIGIIAALRRDYVEASRLFAASREEFQQAGYLRGEVIALANSGWAALEQKDFTGACRVLGETRLLARELGDTELEADASINLAHALGMSGEPEAAVEEAVRAFGHFTKSGNDRRRAECYRVIGRIYCEQGDLEAARRAYRAGFELALALGLGIEAAELTEAMNLLPASAGEVDSPAR